MPYSHLHIVSIKEALFAKRTLAVMNYNVFGRKELLEDFFQACFSIEKLYSDEEKSYFSLKNLTSLELSIQTEDEVSWKLLPGKTIRVELPKDKESVTVTVLNFYYGADDYLITEIKLNGK